MAVAHTSRGVMGDRSTAGGCLVMVYTVYKGVGCGMGAQSADFHDTAQIATNNFTFYRSIAFNLGRFDQS